MWRYTNHEASFPPCTDPELRPAVRDLVPLPGNLYPVGRLDFDSEGLILMTNDGDLANKLTHPRYEHEKEYRVLVAKHPDQEQLNTWRRGMVLEDGFHTGPADVYVEAKYGKGAWLNVTLKEGHKRQIREMGIQTGLPVVTNHPGADRGTAVGWSKTEGMATPHPRGSGSITQPCRDENSQDSDEKGCVPRKTNLEAQPQKTKDRQMKPVFLIYWNKGEDLVQRWEGERMAINKELTNKILPFNRLIPNKTCRLKPALQVGKPTLAPKEVQGKEPAIQVSRLKPALQKDHRQAPQTQPDVLRLQVILDRTTG